MKFFTTKRMVRCAVIAALYASLTFAFFNISYSGSQVRVSEALTLLPLIMPEAVVGLTIGCLISNFFGNGLPDIIFGTLATLLASLCTYFIGRFVRKEGAKITLGVLPPIILNAIIVPFTFLALTSLREAYLINLLSVGFGQLIAVCGLGIPLYLALKRFSRTLLLNDVKVAEQSKPHSLTDDILDGDINNGTNKLN